MPASRIAKAASAAFFFWLIVFAGTLQAQQANENERAMIAAAERGELVVVSRIWTFHGGEGRCPRLRCHRAAISSHAIQFRAGGI
jgi:hypothetical protein